MVPAIPLIREFQLKPGMQDLIVDLFQIKDINRRAAC